jgi:hypothetical protein
MKRVCRENGLSLALGMLFLLSLVGQFLAGNAAYTRDVAEHGRAVPTATQYALSGHFLEALFENWESEFLQMALFVLLAVKLRQKGSAESKPLDELDEVDVPPEAHRDDPQAPAPVRRGGVALALYRHSLSLSLFGLFGFSMALHALNGLRAVNAELLWHGKAPQALFEYVTSSRFWFESLQNWQSEFFSVLALTVLSIFLREQGSPQSKPVYAPHAKTGK